MCGEITSEKMKQQFDPLSRCLINREKEIATRYIGLVEDILDEIRKADFYILQSEVKAREDQEDQDTLWVRAIKP
jgi:hypothetical protein